MSKLSYTLYDGCGISVPIFCEPEDIAARHIRVVSFNQKNYDGFRMELLFYPDKIRRRIKLSENLIQNEAPRVVEIDPISIETPHLNLPMLKQMALQEMKLVLDEIEAKPVIVSKENPAAKQKSKKRTQKKKAEHYSGLITSFGVKERINGKRKFNQFCLELVDPKVDENIQIWGIDLKRALEQVNAVVNDKVHVTYNGYIDVHYPEKQADGTTVQKTAKKRSYTIFKV